VLADVAGSHPDCVNQFTRMSSSGVFLAIWPQIKASPI
jgi:hypothetical protein